MFKEILLGCVLFFGSSVCNDSLRSSNTNDVIEVFSNSSITDFDAPGDFVKSYFVANDEGDSYEAYQLYNISLIDSYFYPMGDSVYDFNDTEDFVLNCRYATRLQADSFIYFNGSYSSLNLDRKFVYDSFNVNTNEYKFCYYADDENYDSIYVSAYSFKFTRYDLSYSDLDMMSLDTIRFVLFYDSTYINSVYLGGYYEYDFSAYLKVLALTDYYNYGYDVGYGYGFNAGEDFGYNNGYNTGYIEGLSTADQGTLTDLILVVMDTPLRTFKQIWDFNILGVNIASAVLSLITLAVCIYVLKKVFK